MQPGAGSGCDKFVASVQLRQGLTADCSGKVMGDQASRQL